MCLDEASVKTANKRVATEEVKCEESVLIDAKRMRHCSPENTADIIERKALNVGSFILVDLF